MKTYLSWTVIGVLAACSLAQGQETPATRKDLAEAFVSPPDVSRMLVYWDWVNNSVGKEGMKFLDCKHKLLAIGLLGPKQFITESRGADAN